MISITHLGSTDGHALLLKLRPLKMRTEKFPELLLLLLLLILIVGVVSVASGVTDHNDLRILRKFRKGLENPELLQWPEHGNDPCAPPLWPHVHCSGNRVTQIQVQNLGLIGTLPDDLHHLSMLTNLGLQKNHFTGKLPTFKGLSKLEFAHLGDNQFDTIPWDFFNGLTSIRVLTMDYNPLNETTGWSLPDELAKSVQLTNLSLVSTNLVGPLPEFLATLPALTVLKLSYNKLSGSIPLSFSKSAMRILWLNDQSDEAGLTGPIKVITAMPSLTQVWIHGNKLSGKVPAEIGSLASLKELKLNRNSLVGVIPKGLAELKLELLDISNNHLMGPVPRFMAANVSYKNNRFCSSDPGTGCSPEVNALMDFLAELDYPKDLVWSGNNPCAQWMGIGCDPSSKSVSIINLPSRRLNGTLSPSLTTISSLLEIRLGGNHLGGQIPSSYSEMKSLRVLDLSRNNFEPPLPKFHRGMQVNLDGNPLIYSKGHLLSPPPPFIVAHGLKPPPPASNETITIPAQDSPNFGKSKLLKLVIVLSAIAGVAVALLLLILFFVFFRRRRRKRTKVEIPTAVIHPRDSLDPDNSTKITLANYSTSSVFTPTTNNSTLSGSMSTPESGNVMVSVQFLRKVTNNFAPENELGHGGFGTVYKGELEDGTKIAVKRMEAITLSNNAHNEFHAEISVLSTVRHRHLVSLYGYSTEGFERLLVYEYMPQGALSKHLFQWQSSGLKPLSWQMRLEIALDVARGMEYLHDMAHHSFIHRDLKSANILLDDEYRAKVADFGLVKLAPDKAKSVATKLAGTFGYLAPEYAMTGKASTKVDVFSFGVVLMELLTGLAALDEERPEESRYLADWFCQMKSSRAKLMEAIDKAMGFKEDNVEGIVNVADLASHCTVRDPNHRPDMGHVVSVLSPLVDNWKPFVKGESERITGPGRNVSLPVMLHKWKMVNESDGYSFGNSGTQSDSAVSLLGSQSVSCR